MQPNTLHSQINPHPQPVLIHKKQIRHHLHQKRLTGSGSNPINRPRSQQTRIRLSDSLPDTRPHAQQTQNERGNPSPEDVRARDDDEIGESEGQYADAGYEVLLGRGEEEFGGEEGEHWAH